MTTFAFAVRFDDATGDAGGLVDDFGRCCECEGTEFGFRVWGMMTLLSAIPLKDRAVATSISSSMESSTLLLLELYDPRCLDLEEAFIVNFICYSDLALVFSLFWRVHQIQQSLEWQLYRHIQLLPPLILSEEAEVARARRLLRAPL